VQSAVNSKRVKAKDIESAVIPEKQPLHKERVHSATGVRAVPRIGVNLMPNKPMQAWAAPEIK